MLVGPQIHVARNEFAAIINPNGLWVSNFGAYLIELHHNVETFITEARIDVVVIYKIDRLTRSLMDFARIVDVFDGHDVSFVSVTQQFNTTTSMGRLTLNVLLSFAQFEREVTAERIRDKIAESKKKGMWMGGPSPLGYDAIDKQLVINDIEAETVRQLYQLYLETGSVQRLKERADALGIITKRRRRRDGSTHGGNARANSSLSELFKQTAKQSSLLMKGKSVNWRKTRSFLPKNLPISGVPSWVLTILIEPLCNSLQTLIKNGVATYQNNKE